LIPRVIHQSWKDQEVPARWIPFQRSWRELNPEYDYRFWTDADNRRLVAEHYPGLLPVYDSYPLAINRADVARYLVAHHQGGIYVDLDFECRRPIDPLVRGRTLAFALEPTTQAKPGLLAPGGLARTIGNAFIASTPAHPFWEALLPELVAAKGEENVLDATGPFLLTRAHENYPRQDEITILAPDLIYPLDREQARSLPPADIDVRAGEAYAIHHWAGSWLRERALYVARTRILRGRAV
jgi:mannosyltransferase OCH1-like enzyme